jgi:hypothetical protein
MKVVNFLIVIFISMFILSCKKGEFNLTSFSPDRDLSTLNAKEKAIVQKFEHASLVLQGVFTKHPDLRKEFNKFIAAKLAKTETDQELTFREIFMPKKINLNGVDPDFLFRFQNAFVDAFILNEYPNHNKFDIKFKTADDVKNYFGIKTEEPITLFSNSAESVSNDELLVDFEIYFPYSENWNPEQIVNYAISYHPLTNVEWNYGMFYDATGNPLYEVTVNDDFAFTTPTYIITYDDGLKIGDFLNGNSPIGTNNYKINLSDDEYNPIVIQNSVNSPNPSPCLRELRVKDGRWTLLRNGYGLFEGKIEFAVAVTNNLSEVSIPNQFPNSNPIIKFGLTGQAWGYLKIRRGKVRKMIDDTSEYISFGLNVSPWCQDQPDKLMFLYEYDMPNTFSSNAKEWSQLLSASSNLVSDSTQRSQINALMSQGLTPVVQVLLEGTAQSKIEHYSIIGSNAVWNNQKIPTNGMLPSLLNGYRPYGTNSVNVTLTVD